MTTQLIAPAGDSQFIGMSGTVYQCDNNGLVQVNPGDVSAAINAGWIPGQSIQAAATYTAPAAASATLVVHASSLANSTLVLSAQPTLPRKLSTIMAVTGGTVTAGTLTIIGLTNLGTLATEVQSAAVGTATATTIKSTNGFASVDSAILTGVGGATITASITIGTAADVGIVLPAKFRALAVNKEFVDGATETVGTTDTTAACIALTTAPNATHNYSIYYSYVLPSA